MCAGRGVQYQTRHVLLVHVHPDVQRAEVAHQDQAPIPQDGDVLAGPHVDLEDRAVRRRPDLQEVQGGLRLLDRRLGHLPLGLGQTPGLLVGDALLIRNGLAAERQIPFIGVFGLPFGGAGHGHLGLVDLQLGLRLPPIQLHQQGAGLHLLTDAHGNLDDEARDLRADGDA